ncbi:hypothetical protein [Rhodococcoides kyotonense]|uniref:2'-5' RNA ligase superfamily protein n=1 Tax=Rhodococcoides kyotonense TaxID=398843 RepID=A0A239MW31_9NOCA|nr:hypothetical protein [Rhodococcus kyotonensis]SNT46710.1 hypothetical protein SAMN05421642_12349 [Rhodococcus kyotonensis]
MSAVIAEVGYFDLGESYAIVAHIETTPELVDGHERLTLLPHVQTFSEYKLHLTLAYVEQDQATADRWVESLGAVYNGKSIKTSAINYGDLPNGEEKTTKKVDAARALAAAREMKQPRTENLYGTTGHTTPHAA